MYNTDQLQKKVKWKSQITCIESVPIIHNPWAKPDKTTNPAATPIPTLTIFLAPQKSALATFGSVVVVTVVVVVAVRDSRTARGAIGPKFSKSNWSWSGRVPGFQKLFDSGLVRNQSVFLSESLAVVVVVGGKSVNASVDVVVVVVKTSISTPISKIQVNP